MGRREIVARTGLPSCSVGVMMFAIRHPDTLNSYKHKYPCVRAKPKPETPYVKKLISILGMSAAEARATERQIIEKEQRRKQCQPVANVSTAN